MVVMVQGSGATDKDETIAPNAPFRDLAHGLARQGVATLRYDKRNFAYPDTAIANIEEETIDDALTAIGMAQSLSPRVYLLGHSLGAMLAPHIATLAPQLAGIVMMAAPARAMSTIVREQIDFLTPSGASVAYKDSLYNHSVAKSPQYYTGTMARYDQVATAQALTIPMLILQGERDYQVRMTDFRLWQAALNQHTNVTFKSYPRLHHLFIDSGEQGISNPLEYNKAGVVADEVIADIAAFVLSR